MIWHQAEPVELVSPEKVHIRWSDADDFVRFPLNQDAAPENVRVRGEMPAPQSVADYNDIRGQAVLFRSCKPPAHARLDSKHVKELCRNTYRSDSFWLARPIQIPHVFDACVHGLNGFNRF